MSVDSHHAPLFSGLVLEGPAEIAAALAPAAAAGHFDELRGAVTTRLAPAATPATPNNLQLSGPPLLPSQLQSQAQTLASQGSQAAQTMVPLVPLVPMVPMVPMVLLASMPPMASPTALAPLFGAAPTPPAAQAATAAEAALRTPLSPLWATFLDRKSVV